MIFPPSKFVSRFIQFELVRLLGNFVKKILKLTQELKEKINGLGLQEEGVKFLNLLPSFEETLKMMATCKQIALDFLIGFIVKSSRIRFEREITRLKTAQVSVKKVPHVAMNPKDIAKTGNLKSCGVSTLLTTVGGDYLKRPNSRGQLKPATDDRKFKQDEAVDEKGIFSHKSVKTQQKGLQFDGVLPVEKEMQLNQKKSPKMPTKAPIEEAKQSKNAQVSNAEGEKNIKKKKQKKIVSEFFKAYQILKQDARLLPPVFKAENSAEGLIDKIYADLVKFNTEIKKSRENYVKKYTEIRGDCLVLSHKSRPNTAVLSESSNLRLNTFDQAARPVTAETIEIIKSTDRTIYSIIRSAGPQLTANICIGNNENIPKPEELTYRPSQSDSPEKNPQQPVKLTSTPKFEKSKCSNFKKSSVPVSPKGRLASPLNSLRKSNEFFPRTNPKALSTRQREEKDPAIPKLAVVSEIKKDPPTASLPIKSNPKTQSSSLKSPQKSRSIATNFSYQANKQFEKLFTRPFGMSAGGAESRSPVPSRSRTGTLPMNSPKHELTTL